MYLSQLDFIKHINDEVLFIEQVMTGKTIHDVENNLFLQKALIRSLEVIGEATKKISPELRAKYPQIDWRGMAGTRDKLIHNYFNVDLELVFDITQTYLPTLKSNINLILKNESEIL